MIAGAASNAAGRTRSESEDLMARILIADDEEPMRSLIARALKQDGHEVTTANDGAEALDTLTRANGAFELMLSDIRMPIMDGIALALAAARDHPAVTILLMTGYADQRERASGLDALIHDVIAKPFTLATMRTAVNDALGARAARATM
jgi:two-component system, cell cycle response regulator CpdR